MVFCLRGPGQPSPPPNHPQSILIGWLGGGAGWPGTFNPKAGDDREQVV